MTSVTFTPTQISSRTELLRGRYTWAFRSNTNWGQNYLRTYRQMVGQLHVLLFHYVTHFNRLSHLTQRGVITKRTGMLLFRRCKLCWKGNVPGRFCLRVECRFAEQVNTLISTRIITRITFTQIKHPLTIGLY